MNAWNRLGYFGFDGEPITSATWVAMFEDHAGRQIGRDLIELPGGSAALVSTVWIGLNHRYTGDGPPLIFETMIFWDSERYDSDDYCERTATRAAALSAHDQAVAYARELGVGDASAWARPDDDPLVARDDADPGLTGQTLASDLDVDERAHDLPTLRDDE